MELAADASLCCLPRTIVARDGSEVELDLLPDNADERLVEMYLAFQPRDSFQGLPPIRDSVCTDWVRTMLRTGINVAARRGGDIVGHTALFRVSSRKCEILVAVCPAFQNMGIGTELVRTSIDLAYELGFERVWLPFDATNVRARHVYEKCGFQCASNHRDRELEMACVLKGALPFSGGVM